MHFHFKRKGTIVIVSCISSCLVLAFLANAWISGRQMRSQKRVDRGEPAENLPGYAEGEVLVVFKKGLNRIAVDNIADSVSVSVEKHYPSIAASLGRQIAHLKSGSKTTQQMIKELKGLPEIESVSPNFRRQICSTIPNDARFSELWGLHNTGQDGGTADMDVDAPEAWDISTGSSSVIVAVIDTGIDYNHPDLAANMWVNPDESVDGVDNDGNGFIDDIHGINAIMGSGSPMDDHGHGTHCAGTIGGVGNNSQGVAGVNWNVKLMGLKFIAPNGGWDDDAITCIDYVIDKKTNRGQNIVATNNSWGGGDHNPALESAIDALGAAGVVFCASAGNDYMDNDATPHYPSCYTCSNIISVTAIDRNGAQFYNYGLTSVDIGAPGRSILSSLNGEYVPQSGDIFYNNVDSGFGVWTSGGVNNSWGVTNAAAGGLENWWWDMSYNNFGSDSPNAPYADNVDSWMGVSGNIDLSSCASQPVFIGFDGGFHFDWFFSNDNGILEISNDGGGTWTPLLDLAANYAGWGYFYNFHNYEIPSSFRTSTFKFRFHVTTDDTESSPGSEHKKGWIIDNLGIGTDASYDYASWNGTSMATPHVTGAVALIAGQFPAETLTERVARILGSAAPLSSLSGKCVTGGLVNLYNALIYVHPPDINVKRGGLNFADGSTTNFGTYSIDLIAGKEVRMTIENKGLGTLNLTGTPGVSLSGPDAAYFKISKQPASIVSPGGSTNFKLKTAKDKAPSLPTGWQKTFAFTVNIPSDDPDENPYSFTISFTAKKY